MNLAPPPIVVYCKIPLVKFVYLTCVSHRLTLKKRYWVKSSGQGLNIRVKTVCVCLMYILRNIFLVSLLWGLESSAECSIISNLTLKLRVKYQDFLIKIFYQIIHKNNVSFGDVYYSTVVPSHHWNLTSFQKEATYEVWWVSTDGTVINLWW